MEVNQDYRLVIFNDDVNSFQYVMACLIRFCMHEPQQAEQCAIIANNAGRCAVKHGSYYAMENMKDQLTGLNIKAKVEENESNMY